MAQAETLCGFAWKALFTNQHQGAMSFLLSDSAAFIWTKNEILRGQPFLLEAGEVNSAAACNKACYMAIGWLLNMEASKSSVDCVVLKQTMPDGRIKHLAVHPTEEDLVFPWEVTKIPHKDDAR
jgi:hypothetical protein